MTSISRSSARLMALTNDLLTLASLEPGALISEPADIDLRDVVHQARSALLPYQESRRLEVTFEVPDEPVVIHGDARHLERLVSNLLTNAVEFTDDGGAVRLTLSASDRRARLVVSDNGMGIPEDEQEGCSRGSSAPPTRKHTTSRAPVWA